MIIIFSIAFLACLSVILLNSRYISSTSAKGFSVKTSFFDQAQNWYEGFIPEYFKLYIDKNIFYTNSTKKNLYQDLFYSFITSIFILLAYLYTQEFYLLVFALVVLFAVVLDFAFKVQEGKRSFIDSLDHLVACLEVLTVKAETPLSNALKVIVDSLPDELFVAKNELNSILVKADKFGMEQVLGQIERDSNEEQEFISILQSIQKGTNKSALKKNLADFLYRQTTNKEEKRKLIVENMQLYMMLPGTVMLIIAMYPLIDMILFQIKGSI